MHVGSWMAPSYDPELSLVYVGTSVTSPAPKFLLGGIENNYLYHNSTLALDGDTGEIVWYYQHFNDHWDLDHPFERIFVDTAVAPDPSQVSWSNPRLQPGETRRVVTGIPGKTGVVYTLDRATGEFLWATPTVLQNVISGIDGATGAVTENAEVTFTAVGQQVFACPTWNGKDWESVYRSPRASVDPVFARETVDPNGPKKARKWLVEAQMDGSAAGRIGRSNDPKRNPLSQLLRDAFNLPREVAFGHCFVGDWAGCGELPIRLALAAPVLNSDGLSVADASVEVGQGSGTRDDDRRPTVDTRRAV